MKEDEEIIGVPAEIVKQEETRVERFLDDTTLANLEKSLANYKKLITTALKLTNEGDWVDENGKPYLQATGCEKVKTPFGIEWYGLELTKLDRGDHYIILVKGKVRSRLLGVAEIEVIGTRKSNDKFFTQRGGKTLPVDEVDEPNIMKSAMSNFEVNAVTRILGIRGLTWGDVEKAGIKKGGVARVEYKDRKKKQADSNPATSKLLANAMFEQINRAENVETLKNAWGQMQMSLEKVTDKDRTLVVEAKDRKKVELDEKAEGAPAQETGEAKC